MQDETRRIYSTVMNIIQNTVNAILNALQLISDKLHNVSVLPSIWQSWFNSIGTQTKNTYHLKDHTCVKLRLVGPQDRKHFLNGFSRISAKTNINRFHTFKTGFTEKELRYLLDIDNVHHLAIGAIDCKKKNIGIGIARYISQADHPQRAEAAIVVIDEYQGKGLGTLLYQALIDKARENGIVTLNNIVMKDNRAMLHLLEQMGAQQVSENQQVYNLELQLSSPIQSSSPEPSQAFLCTTPFQNNNKNTSLTTI